MKCNKCGEEVRNFPEHLAGLAPVVCTQCAGSPPPTNDLESIRERYIGRYRREQSPSEEEVVAA
jgi:hypothetical protein